MENLTLKYSTDKEINWINRKIRNNKPGKGRQGSEQEYTHKKCTRCGENFPHSGPCPAMGKQCRTCMRWNHYSKECRSGPPRPSNEMRRKKQKPKRRVNHTRRPAADSDTEASEPETSDSSDEFSLMDHRCTLSWTYIKPTTS
jgi:hypothetical protein